MLRLLRARFRMLRTDDSGFALPTVIGITIVMLILVASALTSATGNIIRTTTDSNQQGASAAAYAGVEEYMSRLTNDSTYYQWGNSASTFSTNTGSTFTQPMPNNPAFGVGTSGTWATVPGTTEKFRYEVDNSDYSTQGDVRIRATGMMGSATSTIIADIRQKGFIDYVYFTDYETTDPSVTGQSTNCARHTWDNPARPSGCTAIQFGSKDTITGNIHSNDALLICGATFTGTVESSAPSPGYSIPTTGNCPNKTYPVVSNAPTLVMPATNKAMAQQTVTSVANPGCLYTGPTKITFLAGGKMNVVSPWTKATQTNSSGGAVSNSQCGAIGTSTNQLGNVSGATVNVPNNNIIYVQNVPATATDANYWKATDFPKNLVCTGYGLQAGWTLSPDKTSDGSTIMYPMNNEKLPATSSQAASYGCRNGDAYTQGTVGAAVTIGTDNYIYVTGDLKYDPSVATAILGLVAQNTVWVYNPVTASGATINTDSPRAVDAGREIDAAIIAVNHTFMAENYNSGSYRGPLTLLGAIAQPFRGTVATTDGTTGAYLTGYSKLYGYDQRLKHSQPPKFLNPATTSFNVTQFASVAPAFSSTGQSQ